MNDGFKQRLVGAIVLACLASILWPVIFSGPNSPALDRRSQILEMPVFKKYSVAEPVRPDNIERVVRPKVEELSAALVTPAKRVSLSAVDNASRLADKSPRLDDRGLPESWILQVASFTKASNAEALKLALQKKGYKAFTRYIATDVVTKQGEGNVTRVYIGPKLSKGAFNKDKPLIDKAFLVNSVVVKFVQ
ncbi:MAG: SPOR domain-containing protein [Pseudomonadales bacterium]